MSLKLEIRDNAPKAIEAFERAPDAMVRNVDAKLGRGAQETARMEAQIIRENRSMASTLLALSVLNGVKRVAPMHWQVVAGTAYARMVDEGTGPAAGKPPYWPDSRLLEAYIKQRAGITHGGRPGSPRRRSQEREIRDRAQGLARYIANHGTKPHPYAQPTIERMTSRLQQLHAEGVRAGLDEVFGR